MQDKDQKMIIAQQWRLNWDNEITAVFFLVFSTIIPSKPFLDSPQHLTSAIAHIIHDPQRDSLGSEATRGQSYFKKHILVSNQKHQNLMSQKKNPSAEGEAGRHIHNCRSDRRHFSLWPHGAKIHGYIFVYIYTHILI